MIRILIAGVTSYHAPYRPRQETDDIANDSFYLPYLRPEHLLPAHHLITATIAVTTSTAPDTQHPDHATSARRRCPLPSRSNCLRSLPTVQRPVYSRPPRKQPTTPTALVPRPRHATTARRPCARQPAFLRRPRYRDPLRRHGPRSQHQHLRRPGAGRRDRRRTPRRRRAEQHRARAP